MPVRVVDASALGALLFGEPEAEKVAGSLSEGVLAAPALLPFELASIALKKIASDPDSEGVVLDNLALHARMRIETVAVDQAGVVHLAHEVGLTTYDAAYLWLFSRLGADELVTLDRELASAARRR